MPDQSRPVAPASTAANYTTIPGAVGGGGSRFCPIAPIPHPRRRIPALPATRPPAASGLAPSSGAISATGSQNPPELVACQWHPAPCAPVHPSLMLISG